MGLVTHDQFVAELEAVVGDSLDAARASRWVNFAYQDLIGAVEFEELRSLVAAGDTVIGTETLAVPADTRQVTAVILGKNNYLDWADRTELLRRDRNTAGTPSHWTRIGGLIYLNPVPDAVVAAEFETKTDPAQLTTAATTDLPNTWDQSVHLLSVANAYMARSEEGRAAFWFNRAVAHIQTRASEEGRKLHEPGLGLTLPLTPQELLDRQGGQ